MATSASYAPGSAMAVNTPAPCWLSQRHDHAAVAGAFSPGGRQMRHQIPAAAMARGSGRYSA